MKVIRSAVFVTLTILALANVSRAQHSHDSMKGMDMPANQPQKTPAKSSLKPAEGASVRSLHPPRDKRSKATRFPSNSSW